MGCQRSGDDRREREEDRGERADADAEDGDDADHDRIDARPSTTTASDAVEAAARAVGARGGLKIGFPHGGRTGGRGCAHLALLVELHGRAGHLVDLGGHGPGESLKRGLRLDAGHEARALARQLAERHARLAERWAVGEDINTGSAPLLVLFLG